MDEKKTKAQLAQELESLRPQVAPPLVSGVELEPSERSASQAEVELRRLVDKAPVGIFRIAPDGRYLMASPALAQMYGYSSPEELIATATDIDDKLFVEPGRRAKFNQEVRLHGFVSRFESQGRRKDSSILWTAKTSHAVKDDTGAILYYEGFVEDITERKRAQEEAERSAGETRLLYSTAAAAATTDSFDEALQRCLDLICEYIRWPVGHLYVPTPRGTGDLEPTSVWHLDDPQAFQLFRDVTERTRFAPGVGLPGRVMSSGEPAWIADVQKDDNFPRNKLAEDLGVRGAFGFPIKIGTQTVAVLEFFTTEVMEADEHILQVMRMVGSQIGRVLERERAQAMLMQQAEEALLDSNHRLQVALEELKQTQTRVIQQERLQALGLLASGIAHDFNNALVPILGFTELLLDRDEESEDRQGTRNYLQMISTAAQDAASVVNRLREFYRPRGEGDRFTSVDIDELVAQVISLTQGRWKDEAQANSVTIAIETDLKDVPPVWGSQSELRELLSNLILNAVDAMPHGGTITLRTRSEGSQIALEVADTGIGMSEEIRQRCLEPFFTTKGERGTGMGLPMVHATVQRHQGTLNIESEPDEGTTFIIKLPISSTVGHDREETQSIPPTGALRVLVADDEPTVREVVSGYLTRDGHSVEIAKNGREALDKFMRGKFDLVITDRAMPDMSGDQLAASIRTIAPKPVILLTGFAEMMQTRGEHPAGVSLILKKPVTLKGLREAVSKVITGTGMDQSLLNDGNSRKGA